METAFNSIALFGKPNPQISTTLTTIYQFLIEHDFEVLVEHNIAPFLDCSKAQPLLLDDLPKHSDLAIAIGGDGTFLSAARTFSSHQIPLIGINMGRLGFLVDISPTDLPEKLEAVLNGHHIAEERHLLNVRIIRNERTIHEQNAMNEVVIHRWVTPEMIHINTHINHVFLNEQRSDGLIISTPTGSTAYALSGGGPIITPTQNVTLLVPINPHTLSHRPIIIDADSEIEVTFTQNTHINAQLSCDEIGIPDVTVHDRIVVTKARHNVRILHPSDYDFYNTLRAKLHWSS
ncbi:MAG: NAD(+) kinase [Gammaproteobacteria bacterium]|nr:NAD(+) kinase [Gammaproteobacteria bacterium]